LEADSSHQTLYHPDNLSLHARQVHFLNRDASHFVRYLPIIAHLL